MSLEQRRQEIAEKLRQKYPTYSPASIKAMVSVELNWEEQNPHLQTITPLRAKELAEHDAILHGAASPIVATLDKSLDQAHQSRIRHKGTDAANQCQEIVHRENFSATAKADIFSPNSIDYRDPSDYLNTPLHKAVIANAPKEVQRLLRQGANPHIKNSGGDTPLQLALDEEYDGIVKIFRIANEKSESKFSATG